jgi:hypothetical protein
MYRFLLWFGFCYGLVFVIVGAAKGVSGFYLFKNYHKTSLIAYSVAVIHTIRSDKK